MKIKELIVLLVGFLVLTMTTGCNTDLLEEMVNEIYLDEQASNNAGNNSTGNTQTTPAAPSTPDDATTPSETPDTPTTGGTPDSNPGDATGSTPDDATDPSETPDTDTPNPGGTPDNPNPDGSDLNTPTTPEQGGGGSTTPDAGQGGTNSGSSPSTPGTSTDPTLPWGPSTPENDPFANPSGDTRTVLTQSEFLIAVVDPKVSTINLGTDITTVQHSQDNALILGSPKQSLTINGNGRTLNVKEAGIVLGGNLQLSNITIAFSNTTRNAILANGYNLTLNGVKQATSTSKQSIHLFCGGIINYKGANAPLPESGSHGKVIVKGNNNKLGHIYAGNLDDANRLDPSTPNNWDKPSTITWTVGANGTVGTIYAHGARESREEGTGNVLYPAPSEYKCTNTVQINISNSATPDRDILNLQQITIEGATGGSLNALVCYTDNGKGYSFSTILKDIGGLKLEPGTADKAVLAPANGSNLKGTHLVVPAKTRLNFTLNTSDVFEFGSLEGGGTLVLSTIQYIEITGNVKDTTKIAIGGIQNENFSSSRPRVPYTYIIALNSSSNSFKLLPPTTDPNMTLDRNADDGYWRTFIP